MDFIGFWRILVGCGNIVFNLNFSFILFYFSFTKVVIKGMSKAEMILKVEHNIEEKHEENEEHIFIIPGFLPYS